ncbi:hypothetical protein WOLCODRAFT_92323 [Wolfiporia cocos MD-104 SS10]|uniref:Uncharacterized protein n=1 Tax=Wolfiporia cocos (strain MD-104) TaxID=742152 RepID=A0A2H3JKY9_WOLCO|nr:hypothetical protein WOLCODRAFT_92323 [Wolfiporia cocos MD-104 SS10]
MPGSQLPSLQPPTYVSSEIPVYALSFLSKPPANVQSATVIGWLPAIADRSSDEAGLNNFIGDVRFREVLHEAIQSVLRDGLGRDPVAGLDAHSRDPEGIIASVRVEEGMAYPPMPSYCFYTSDGVIQLTEGLAQKLREILHKALAAEDSPAN